MRISELLNEDLDNLGTATASKQTGKSDPVNDHFKAAIKGLQTYPGGHTYYDMYRFGVDMAGNPDDNNNYSPSSPIANQLATLAYTDADQAIIDKSAKKMKMPGKQLTSKDSIEPTETHTSSPVAKIKKNKYGV